MENQFLQEEVASEQGGVAEVGRRASAPPLSSAAANAESSPLYGYSLSFEELSNVGLEEAPRLGNPVWTVKPEPVDSSESPSSFLLSFLLLFLWRIPSIFSSLFPS